MIGSIRPNPADECEDQEWTCPPEKILAAVIARRGTRRRAAARRWEGLLKAAFERDQLRKWLSRRARVGRPFPSEQTPLSPLNSLKE